jgi:diguanylate cyclase (GGDEF)-like protein
MGSSAEEAAVGQPSPGQGARVVALRPDISLPPEVDPALAALAGPADATADLMSRIEESLDRPSRSLYFPAALERRFEQDNLATRSHAQLVKGAIALILFDLFLLSDLTMVPDVFRQMLWLRLGVVTPLGLVALLVLARTPSPRMIEGIISSVSILTTGTILYAITFSHHAFASYYHSGIPLIVIFANIVQRARFWYAAATSLSILLLYIAVAAGLAPQLPPQIVFNYAMVLGSTVLFTLIANYNLERDERRNYLMTLREGLRLSRLEDANARLTRLSATDPLTELPNRRSFESHLQQACLRSAALRQPLSLLMIDVDHFKAYNDRLGHPAGDACLQKVAAAMLGRLRAASGELAARLGGEEFAVVLPGLSEELAEQVAQRIRQAVEDQSLPHPALGADGVVTVSIGVASVAGARPVTPQRLLEAADGALYLAKRAGRNRVRLAGALKL